jgi:lipoprotein-anchoring transpeptidase ErfK/SrfK
MRKLTAILVILLAGFLMNPMAQAATGKSTTVEQGAAKKKKVAKKQCRTFIECLNAKPRSTAARSTKKGKTKGAADRSTAEVVSWDKAGKYSPGSIVVSTRDRLLYFVMDNGKARRYRVGVGKEGFQWSGNSKIVAKTEWPTWRPPAAMIAREAEKGHILPEEMKGGPNNPLGARALYIGGTLYRIHGTNNPGSIGGNVSSGCIRMMNTDVIELYGKVKVGARVYVY